MARVHTTEPLSTCIATIHNSHCMVRRTRRSTTTIDHHHHHHQHQCVSDPLRTLPLKMHNACCSARYRPTDSQLYPDITTRTTTSGFWCTWLSRRFGASYTSSLTVASSQPPSPASFLAVCVLQTHSKKARSQTVFPEAPRGTHRAESTERAGQRAGHPC